MNNIDFDEIKKFNDIANEWWDTNGKFKPLHDINPIRLQFILDNTKINDKKILDIGCGGGILTESLYDYGAKVTGIDLAEDSINNAILHAKKSKKNIDYRVISIEELASKEHHKYDIITCMELLEHVPDPNSIIHSCSKLLKNNGLLFISTLNRNLSSYLQAIIAAEYILNLVPKGTHEYKKFIKPSEIVSIARKHQFTIKELTGFSYNILNKKYFLCRNINVNYLAYFMKNY